MSDEKKDVEPARSEDKSGGIPAKFKDIVSEIEKMSVLDLSELVKVLEERFGVSAQAAVAVSAPASGAGGEEVEEKTSFDATLTSFGEQKVQVIKAVKEALSLGLKEAKDLVDGAPAPLKQGLKKEEAEELKKKIEAAGGKVELT